MESKKKGEATQEPKEKEPNKEGQAPGEAAKKEETAGEVADDPDPDKGTDTENQQGLDTQSENEKGAASLQDEKGAEPSNKEGEGTQCDVDDDTMSPYFTMYPDCNVFYRTSDGQVFLESKEDCAKNHQRSLKGKLQTIKRP